MREVLQMSIVSYNKYKEIHKRVKSYKHGKSYAYLFLNACD